MASKCFVRPGKPVKGNRAERSRLHTTRAHRVRCRMQTSCLATESYGEEDVYEYQLPHEVEVRYARLLKRQDHQLDLMEKQKAGSTKRHTHSNLRVGAGYLKGNFLLSPSDQGTRPMMGKTKNAVFSMLLSQIGVPIFPEGIRWLDLFAGTGSVGIEAISRGCDSCHFVELDHWTANEVLGRNIETLKLEEKSVTHVERVQDFLLRHARNEEMMGGKFDYVSVCPPYNDIVFEELMSQLDQASILSEKSFMFVEYPKEQSHGIPLTCGPLKQLKKRSYGRTIVAIYGPPETS